jgi:4-amino-4-deoxy-L-arabinose transferase-like glycosyltransferase
MAFKNKNIRGVFFILLILFLLGFFLRIFLTNCYYWDEIVYLQHADIFSGKINNYNEFDIRPPLISLIFAGLFKIWNNPLIANLFLTFISSLSIILIYFLGKELFNRPIGLISAFILAFMPYHIYFSKQILVHTLALFFGILFFLFLKRGENKNRSLYFLFSGIFLACVVLTRFTYIILFLILGLNFILFFKKYSIKNVIYLSAGFLLLFLPYLIWIKSLYGDFFYSFRAGSIALGSFSNDFMFYFLNIPVVLSFICLLGLFFWIFFAIKNKDFSKNEFILMLWVLVPIIFLSFASHKELRYAFIIITPAILLAAIGFFKFFKNTRFKKTFFVIFIILLLFFGLIFSLPNFYNRNCNNDAKFVSNWLMENPPESNRVYVLDYYPYVAYYTNLTTIIAPLNKDRFLNKYNPFFRDSGEGYLVYFEAQNRSWDFPSFQQIYEDNRFTYLTEIENNEKIWIFNVNKL